MKPEDKETGSGSKFNLFKGMNRYMLLAILWILLSCSSKKVIKKVKKVELPVLLMEMEENAPDYTWFSAKARVKFEGEEFRMTGRCNVRMIKDSLIWMNFKKLSVEGSRVLITQDSFWIVYRLDNLYESGTLDELMEAYDLDFSFSELQDYVIGRLPVPRYEEVISFRSPLFHELSFGDKSTYYSYKMDNRYLVNELSMTDTLYRKLRGYFENYDERGFARNKIFQIELDDGSRGSIEFNFTDIEIDVPKSIKFEVPDHYTRLP